MPTEETYPTSIDLSYLRSCLNDQTAAGPASPLRSEATAPVSTDLSYLRDFLNG